MKEIDLSQLPPPKAIEEFTFEAIFASKKARLIELCPNHIKDVVAATLELESEPLTIDLQQQAYSEMLLRQRINEATLVTFLAFATGSDLDHIAASRNMSRKIIQAANPHANPPVAQINESDSSLRRRVQLYPEKLAAAGSRLAYIAHALDLDDVADAYAVQPRAGDVLVYIQSHSNAGIASRKLLAHVQQYLSAEDKRPLCDSVTVQAATAKPITLRYATRYQSQLGKTSVQQAQQTALQQLIAEHSGLGAQLALSKIIGALDVVGAEKVILHEPQHDVICQSGEFIRIVSIESSELT